MDRAEKRERHRHYEENRIMKKRYWMVPVALAAVTGAGVVWAAGLSNLSGQSCGDAQGTWHFVNNQTGGAAAGVLTANFSTGYQCVTNPSAVNNNMQHFYCYSSGALLGASTNLPGRLQLSDFSCETKKECDPKTEKCEL
jgi:hypothetical protein